MTREDLKNLVYDRLGDDKPSNRGYKESVINSGLATETRRVYNLLNQSGFKYNITLKEYKARTDAVAVTDVGGFPYMHYKLPDDFSRVYSVNWVEEEVEYPLDPFPGLKKNIALINIGISPSIYDIDGNYLVVLQPPDTTNTIRLYYNQKFTNYVNDTSVVPVPDDFIDRIVIYAGIQARKRNGDAQYLIDYDITDYRDARRDTTYYLSRGMKTQRNGSG